VTVPQVCLDAVDAVELGETLGFIGDWLVSDRERLAAGARAAAAGPLSWTRAAEQTLEVYRRVTH